MIWPALRAAISVTLGAIQLASDAYDAGKRLIRRLNPSQQPDSTPLTWRDVAHQQEQIRSATTKKP